MGKSANHALILCALSLVLMGCTSKAVKKVAVPPDTVTQQQGAPTFVAKDRSQPIAVSARTQRNRPRIDEVYPARYTGDEPGKLSSRRKGPSSEGNISLDFKDADIREVIRTILGDLLKFNYLIDPKVTGTVTLVAKRRVRRDALLPILESILGPRGFTIIERDSVYRVLPVGDRAGLAAGGIEIASSKGRSPVRIYPLGFMSAAEMQKISRDRCDKITMKYGLTGRINESEV